MKLDRNKTADGHGKYALIPLRKVPDDFCFRVQAAKTTMFPESYVPPLPYDLIEFGLTPETGFFVLKYRDKFAGPTLRAYAKEVEEEAQRSRRDNPDLADSLMEYYHEIIHQAEIAEGLSDKKIPT